MNRHDLVEHTLRMIGVIEAEETPTAADSKLVDNLLLSEIAKLQETDVIAFDADSIPDSADTALMQVVGFRALPMFGLPTQPELMAQGMRTLRETNYRAWRCSDRPIPNDSDEQPGGGNDYQRLDGCY